MFMLNNGAMFKLTNLDLPTIVSYAINLTQKKTFTFLPLACYLSQLGRKLIHYFLYHKLK